MKKKTTLKKSINVLLAITLAIALIIPTTPGGQAVKAAGDTQYTDEATGYTYTLHTDSETAEQTAEITGYTGNKTDLTIPRTIAGCKVTAIGTEAFKENTEITSVVIEEGIEQIGYQSFYNCSKMHTLTLPSTIRAWQERTYESKAFENCTSLTELTLAEGMTILGQNAFAGCTSLETVIVPSTIETFENRVFYGCTNLRNLTLREGIRQIGYQAFRDCTALESVTIPSTIESWGILRSNGITTILNNCEAFYNCTSLQNIELKEGLKTLQNFQGLKGCPGITEIKVPSTVENIAHAFVNCTYLEKIELQPGLTTIGDNAFKGCSSLKEINIPDTVTTIGSTSFQDCTSLETLTIPEGVTQPGYGQTSGCNNLHTINILTPYLKWYQRFYTADDGTIYCIKGSSTHETLLANMSDADKEKLQTYPETEAEAEGYTGIYDGQEHDAITLTGTEEGDTILYRMWEGETLNNDNIPAWQTDVPKIKEAGVYTVEILVKRNTENSENIESTESIEHTDIDGGTDIEDIEQETTPAYAISDLKIRAEIEESSDPGQNVDSQNPSGNTVTNTDNGKNTSNTGTDKDTGNTGNSTGTQIQKPTVKKGTLKKVQKTSKKKTLKITWKKVSGAEGYEIAVSLNRKFKKSKKYNTITKAIKGNKTTYTIKNLKKSKKTYYVKIRAYKTYKNESGQTIKAYGKYSKVKKAKTK